MGGNSRRGMVVQARDEHMLHEAAVMRVFDCELAKLAAPFHSTSRANARLLALVNAGLLRRFFQGTRAGGTKALYTLTPKGARLIGVPYNGLRHGKDELIVTNFFIAHQMAVNEFYCAVKYGPKSVPGMQFIRWLTFAEPIAPATQLVPDGFCELTTPHTILSAFLEIDLGHEGMPVWNKKVANYLGYAASGKFEERFRQNRFRVLVITNSERRLEGICTVVGSLTDKIFWLSTLDAIRRESPWGPIWRRPTANTPQSLF
jgi:hypothetical protein